MLALAEAYDERIVLADFDGTILVDSARLLDGEDAPLPRRATVVDPSSTLIELELDEEAFENLDLVNALTDLCLQRLGVATTVNDLGLVTPVGELDPADDERLHDCLEDEVDDEPILAEAADWLVDSPDSFDVASPLQLFIGYGDERDASLTRGLTRGCDVERVGRIHQPV
ncbi:MAG: hypothetical protein AAGK32_06080, partial [Actinomycetota bacterium]